MILHTRKYCLMMSLGMVILTFVSCNAPTSKNDYKADTDTLEILNTTLQYPLLDSMLPTYKDSVLKIIDTHYRFSKYDLKWKNKPVVFLDSTDITMELDSVGLSEALKMKKGDTLRKGQRVGTNFEILITHFKMQKDTATVRHLLKNSGMFLLYGLKKEHDAWVVKTVGNGYQ